MNARAKHHAAAAALLLSLLLLIPTFTPAWTGSQEAQPTTIGGSNGKEGQPANIAPPANDPDPFTADAEASAASVASLLDLLAGKPGLDRALRARDIPSILSTLSPENAPLGNLSDVRLTDVLRALAGDDDASQNTGEDAPVSLEAALKRWANVARIPNAEDDILQALQAESLLPDAFGESLAHLVDALTDAEILRQEAFSKLSEEDRAFLLAFEHTTATPQEIARADEISKQVDMKALMRGTLRLWTETERQLPTLKELANMDLQTPSLHPDALAAPRPPPSPDARFDEAIATILQAVDIPAACAEQAASFSRTREGESPLRDALSNFILATGGSPIDVESTHALAAANSLPLELQQAIARIIDAHVFALRESLRSALEIPIDCSSQTTGPTVGALALLHAMKTSAPSVSKWGLVIAHSPAIDQVGDLDAFGITQSAAAAAQDGTAAAAVAYAAWQAQVPLRPPQTANIAPERTLELAVLQIYDAMDLQATEGQRLRLAEDAAAVAPWLQVEAARVIVAQAHTIRAMRAPTNGPALAIVERDAAEAHRRILSPMTTWEDVLWLREYYAHVDVADALQTDRYQSAYELALAIDDVAETLRRLPLDELPGATNVAKLTVQSARIHMIQTGPLDLLQTVWQRLSPIGSAAAQPVPRPPGDPTQPPPATLPRELEGSVPSGTNDVLFTDPAFGLIVIGGTRSTIYRETLNADNPGRQVLTIDLGGNDIYLNSAGGATTEGTRPVPLSVAIDLSGNDRYDARVPYVAQGAALATTPDQAGQNTPDPFSGAVGILIDYQGDDRYTGPAISQGAAAVDTPQGFALGILIDGRGNDTYSASLSDPLLRAREGQVAADIGGWQAFAMHWRPTRTGVRATDTQTEAYTLSVLSVASGVLIDLHGDDRFTTERGQGAALVEDTHYTPMSLTVETTQEEVGNREARTADLTTYGWRPHAFAALISRGGNDTYTGCTNTCQGAGAGGLGILADFEGTDRYSAGSTPPFEGAPSLRGNDRHWFDGRFGVGIDASSRDEDQDALPSYLEYVLGTSDSDANSPGSAAFNDTDADGAPDVLERWLRTDPHDPKESPAIRPSGLSPLAGPTGSDKIIDLGLNSRLAENIAGVSTDVELGAALGGPLPRLFALGSTTDTNYATGRDYSLIIDLGGRDSYRNNAGGNLAFTVQPTEAPQTTLAQFALSGLDPSVKAVQGSTLGLQGLPDISPSSLLSTISSTSDGQIIGGLPGVVFDVAGDDTYQHAGERPSQGGANGTGALGLLVDLQGNDKYRNLGTGLHQGAAKSPDSSATGAVGMLLDLGGKDEYRSPLGESQAYASGRLTFAYLLDASTTLGIPPGPPLIQGNVFEARSQAFAIGNEGGSLGYGAVALFAAVGEAADTYRSTDATATTLVQGLTQGTHAVATFVDIGGYDTYISADGTDHSQERNDLLRLPPYPIDSRNLSFYLDTATTSDSDTDTWPDLVEAMAGTSARERTETPAATDANHIGGFLINLANLGIAVGNGQHTAYSRDYHLVIDLGGNNDFYNNAGGGHAATALLIIVAKPVDENIFEDPASGRDVDTFGRSPVQGAGRYGIGVAVLDGGSASFEATGLAQGAAELGAGLLVLKDTLTASFHADRAAQGAVLRNGIGILWNQGTKSNDDYEARTLAQGAAFFAQQENIARDEETGAAILYDAGGNDRFHLSEGVGQAYASGDGLSMLISAGGQNDTYVLGGGLGQGAGHNEPVMGIDGLSVQNAQSYPLALLIDEGGNDSYSASGQGTPAYAQGYGRAGAGVLIDKSGADTYTITLDHPDVFAQGVGHSPMPPGTRQSPPAIGILSDESGRDQYIADGSWAQGASPERGTGLFLEWSGDDHYVAAANAQGAGRNAMAGVGLFADVGGWDAYPSRTADLIVSNSDRRNLSQASGANCHGPEQLYFNRPGNQAIWRQDGGIGIDATGTDATTCIGALAAKSTYNETKDKLPYYLLVAACPGMDPLPTHPNGDPVLRGEVCVEVRLRNGVAYDRNQSIERAELYVEGDTRIGRENISSGTTFLKNGAIRRDGNLVATFRIDASEIDDGFTWLIARLHHRAPWQADDVLAPVVIDNPPQVHIAGAGNAAFNPQRGKPDLLLHVSRDLPNQLSREETERARESQKTPLQTTPDPAPLPPPIRAPPFLMEVTNRDASVPRPTLTLAPASGGGVTLEWTSVKDAEAYVIYRASTSTTTTTNPMTEINLDTKLLGWIPATSTRLVDRNVTHELRYWYFVAAVQGLAGEKPPHVGSLIESKLAASFVRNIDIDATKPGIVSGLRAEGGDGWVTLAWPATPLATSYLIERVSLPFGSCQPPNRDPDPDCSVDRLFTETCTETCYFVNTNVSNGRTYSYRVGAATAAALTPTSWSSNAIVKVDPGAFVHIKVHPDAPIIRYVGSGADVAWTWDAEDHADGAYRATASATDANGHPSATAGSINFSIDREPPISRVDSPRFVNADDRIETEWGPGVTLTWKIHDANTAPLDVSVGRMSQTGAVLPWMFRLQTDTEAKWPLPHGETTAIVTLARDAAGNLEDIKTKAPQLITADYVPPVIQQITAPAHARPGDAVELVVEAKDDVSGIRSIRAWLPGSAAQPLLLRKTTGTSEYASEMLLAVPQDHAGEFILAIEAEDFAGNKARRDHPIILDAKAPEFLDTIMLYEFGGELGAGRPGGAARLQVLVSDDNEVTRVSANISNVSLASTASFTRNALTGWFEADMRFDAENLSDGDHSVIVLAEDASNNVIEKIFNVTIDGRAVTIENATVAEVGTTWVRLTWNTTENATSSATAGVDPALMRQSSETVEFGRNHDYNLTGLVPGRTYHVSPASHTRSGIAAVPPKFVVDMLPPLPLRIIRPNATTAWSGTATLGWTLDGSSAPVDYRVTLTAGERDWPVANFSSSLMDVNASFDTRLVPDGRYRLAITATQGHNQTRVLSDILTIDNTPPRIKDLSPAPGDVVRGSDILIEGIVTDEGSGNLTGSVDADGLHFNATMRGAVFRVLARGLPEGHNVIVLTIRDAAGNQAIERIPIMVDQTALRVEEAMLLNEHEHTACAPPCEFTLRVRAAGRGSVGGAIVKSGAVDPSTSALALTPEGWLIGSFRIIDGEHGERIPIDLRLEDALHKVAYITALRVLVDREAPLLSGLSASPSGPTSLVIRVNASEPTSLRVIVNASDGSLLESRSDIRAANHVLTLDGLASGVEHEVHVSLRDAAGNVAVAATRARTLRDLVPPGQVASLRGGWVNGGVTLEWSAADDNVALKAYRIYRLEDDAPNGRPIAEAESLTFTDHAPVLDRANTYFVRAVDRSNNEGPASPAFEIFAPAALSLRQGSVTPQVAQASEPFTFSVLLTSPRDPANVLVDVVIDFTPHRMTREANDTCRIDCLYVATFNLRATQLGEPQRTFSFLATDGPTTIKYSPEGEANVGPLVIRDAEQASQGLAAGKLNVPFGEPLTLVGALAGAILLALGRRRKP